MERIDPKAGWFDNVDPLSLAPVDGRIDQPRLRESAGMQPKRGELLHIRVPGSAITQPEQQYFGGFAGTGLLSTSVTGVVNTSNGTFGAPIFFFDIPNLPAGSTLADWTALAFVSNAQPGSNLTMGVYSLDDAGYTGAGLTPTQAGVGTSIIVNPGATWQQITQPLGGNVVKNNASYYVFGQMTIDNAGGFGYVSLAWVELRYLVPPDLQF